MNLNEKRNVHGHSIFEPFSSVWLSIIAFGFFLSVAAAAAVAVSETMIIW